MPENEFSTKVIVVMAI